MAGNTMKSASPNSEQQSKTEGYLLFEEALEVARKEGKLEASLTGEQKLKWGNDDVQQDRVIKSLSKDTDAKAEFNRLCKEDLGIKLSDEKLGNTRRLQAAHPPEVAIKYAVKVFLKYWAKYGEVQNQTKKLKQLTLDEMFHDEQKKASPDTDAPEEDEAFPKEEKEDKEEL
ncbi:hypothetical protein Bbelb_277250 [Branchiostoma belcheri]|nr:hypothetical protein Bbelb_277250 [Branchiostoma belcheri]